MAVSIPRSAYVLLPVVAVVVGLVELAVVEDEVGHVAVVLVDLHVEHDVVDVASFEESHAG